MPVLIPANYVNDENNQFFESNCESFFNNNEVELNESEALELLKDFNVKTNDSPNQYQSNEQSCLSKKEDISSPRVTSTVDATDFIDKDETINSDKIRVDAESSNKKNEELLFAVTSSMNLSELAERLYSNIDSEQVFYYFIF